MSRVNNIGIKGVQYTKPVLSGDVMQFTIPNYDEVYKPTQPTHPFYTYYNKPFDATRLQYSPLPLHIGEFNIEYDEKNVVNVLRCAIKNKSNRQIYLPTELLFLKDFVEYCCVYELSFNDK